MLAHCLWFVWFIMLLCQDYVAVCVNVVFGV
jgi:hypothetical protein